jgi:dynein heavy chain
LKWKGKEWNVKIKDVKNIYEMYYNGKSNNWLHWL